MSRKHEFACQRQAERLALASLKQRVVVPDGYEVTIVSDATSSLSPEGQQAALNFALTNIASIKDTAAIAAAL